MKKSVLFVDDELHIIEALFDVMKAEGYEVETCSSITAAVKKIRDREYACVVLDIMIDPGEAYPHVDPSNAGVFAVSEIQKTRKAQSIVCHSVISDLDLIKNLRQKGVLFLRKGETSLEKAKQVILSKATGLYTSR